MTKSPLGLALQIAQLLEDNSDKDIRAAVALLESHGFKSGLLEYLSRKVSSSVVDNKETSTRSSRQTLEDSVSKAVVNLKDKDPEKYKLLLEFDQMVRRGQALTTLEHMKRFGEHISKDFEPRKSRKETISPLLTILSDRSLAEIESLIEFAASFGVSGDTDEYQRLAQFLIKGRIYNK
ncbi:MAG: hypothetical protein PHH11_08735 [Methylomonas sp.]|nr:hypothetical protein [Methylomonas sp.]